MVQDEHCSAWIVHKFAHHFMQGSRTTSCKNLTSHFMQDLLDARILMQESY